MCFGEIQLWNIKTGLLPIVWHHIRLWFEANSHKTCRKIVLFKKFPKHQPCLDMTSHSISASPGCTIEQIPSESALQTFPQLCTDPTGGPPFLADPDTFSFGISTACLPTPIAGLVQSETHATLIYNISWTQQQWVVHAIVFISYWHLFKQLFSHFILLNRYFQSFFIYSINGCACALQQIRVHIYNQHPNMLQPQSLYHRRLLQIQLPEEILVI